MAALRNFSFSDFQNRIDSSLDINSNIFLPPLCEGKTQIKSSHCQIERSRVSQHKCSTFHLSLDVFNLELILATLCIKAMMITYTNDKFCTWAFGRIEDEFLDANLSRENTLKTLFKAVRLN